MATAVWTILTVWRVAWNARPDTSSRNFAGNLGHSLLLISAAVRNLSVAASHVSE